MAATLATVHVYVCANGCGQEWRTDKLLGPGSQRMHICPRLRMLASPLVPEGSRSRVFLREREDYIGKEVVQLDPERGRPVMSIVTERPDGSNDVNVLAPMATGRFGR